jgi:hypothetical protein
MLSPRFSLTAEALSTLGEKRPVRIELLFSR